MKHRPAVHDCIIELFDLGLAPSPARWQSDFSLFTFAVNKQPVASLADIASFAAYQGEAKERLLALPRPNVAELAFALPAEAHLLLKSLFLFRASYLMESSSHVQVCFGISVLPSFSHPTKQLRSVEETITDIDQCSRSAVLEYEEAGITLFIVAFHVHTFQRIIVAASPS